MCVYTEGKSQSSTTNTGSKMGGVCYGCVKYLLVVMNFLFTLIGLAIVAQATWMLIDPTFYISMAQDANNYFITTYILLGIGVLLFLTSFFGCCGALRESKCMLCTFFCFLLIVFVAQVSSIIWGYMNINRLEPLVRSTLKTTVSEEYAKVKSRQTTFDAIQSGLRCCGADRPNDWIGNQNIVIAISPDPLYFTIPQSCCREGVTTQACKDATRVLKVGGDIDTRIIYHEGCSDKIIDIIRLYGPIGFYVGVGIIFIEVVGMLFATILIFAINRNNRYKA